MATSEQVFLMPEWTEKVQKRGLDPLGMQNSGVALYQSLLPGISNVTLRVRYYGLYCWASDAYAREVGSTDSNEWRTWIRRIEALHGLVAQFEGSERGVAGVEWALRRLAVGDDPIDFEEGSSTRADAQRYLAQSMGVFGQAYLSQMVELGLFSSGDHHAIPLRSDRGLALAKAYAEAIGPDLAELIISILKRPVVSRAQLSSLGAMLPSRIGRNEREEYERLLFGLHADCTLGDVSRRNTLKLVLMAARMLQRQPRAMEVRRYLFSPRPEILGELETQRIRWEAYQVQDMWQVASAALLRWAISIIDEVEEGRSLPEIYAQVAARLLDEMGKDARESWDAYAHRVDLNDETLNERFSQMGGSRIEPVAAALMGVEQMAALQRRTQSRRDLAEELARSFPLSGGGRSVRSELKWLEDHGELMLPEMLATMITQRIVRRHSWVATQKLRRQRDYTFLFEARDGRLAYRSQYEPVPTTPRLDPAITFLIDIGLLNPNGCTPDGNRILATVP